MALGKKKIQMQGAAGIDNTSNFVPVIYTGNRPDPEPNEQDIVTGFPPDLIITKDRNNAGTNFHVFDVVRGYDKIMYTDSQIGDFTDSDRVFSVDSDSFRVGNDGGTNTNGRSYISWNFKAGGGTSASNTDGSITSTVSANTEAGFSICTYTGTGSNASFGHGLDSAPELVIIKSRNQSTRNWITHFTSLGAGAYMSLNLANPNATSTARINTTTSTVVNIGTSANVNQNNDSLVAYCFHSVTGRTAVGTYEGDGQSDRQITGLGFRPRFVLGKNADTNTTNWWIVDSARGDDKTLLPNNNPTAEISSSTSWGFHLLDDGFEITNGSNINQNKSGDTFVYLAIA